MQKNLCVCVCVSESQNRREGWLVVHVGWSQKLVQLPKSTPRIPEALPGETHGRSYLLWETWHTGTNSHKHELVCLGTVYNNGGWACGKAQGGLASWSIKMQTFRGRTDRIRNQKKRCEITFIALEDPSSILPDFIIIILSLESMTALGPSVHQLLLL